MTTTEILTGIKNWVVGKLNLKQNVISDLADIRSGAQAGATSVQPADILSYFDNAVYDSGTHRINFYHGQSVIAYIDASPFIIDGMVNDVRIENGYLVIDFNTDSGKQDISIPLTDIFNPNNYYTKSETDSHLTQKQSEIDDLYARIGYYVCFTDGNVAAKTIVANNYTLGNGGSIKIKMTNANTVNNATLNINSTGAKALYYDGERASAKNSWEAGETVEVYYDGTSFYANNIAGGSGSGDGAFDVSAKYPTSGVDGGNTYTLEGALAVLNANLSASKKKGGMSIKFIHSYDNKYVQYRLMSDSWSIDTNDWSFCGDSVYVENPEWIYVLLDAEKRILAGLKSDGSVEWSIGVPTPVKTYIANAIAEIKNGTEGTDLDGLNKIIAFLSEFSTSDTLKDLLDEKVDKEEGKSLIDAKYANGVHYIENPEFAEVKLDADDRILEATTLDGTKLLPVGYEVGGNVVKTISNPEYLAIWLDSTDHILFALKVNGDVIFGCGVPSQIKKHVIELIKPFEELLHYDDSPEFIEVKLDAEDKVLEGIKVDGTKVVGGDIKVIGNMEVSGISYRIIESPEYIVAWLDAEDKVIFGFKNDGKTYVGDADFLNDIKNNKDAIDEIKTYLSNFDGLDIDALTSIITIENPEYIDAKVDNEDKILEATEKDGTKLFGGDVKVLGSIDINGVTYKVVSNPEWLEVVLDAENRIICGIKTDGKFVVYVADFLDDIEAIKERLKELDAYSVTENPEFMEVELDTESKVLSGRKADGTKFENNDVELNGNATVGGSLEVDGVAIKNIEDPEGRVEIAIDSENKIISYRKDDGTLVENVGIESPKIVTDSLNLSESGMTDFQQALKDSGFKSGAGDWSDYNSQDGDYPLNLAIPRCAMMNILSDYDLTQLSKEGYRASPPYWPAGVEGVTYDIPTQVEFFDMQGNYFKKWTKMSGQGNSSMSLVKKNIALDFFDDETMETAFKVKFGEWVPQDSFHIKAFYTDAFRCVSPVTYQLYDEMVQHRGVFDDYFWKRALIDFSTITTTSNGSSNLKDAEKKLESGAKCFPKGFPVIVYQNGEFWGVFSFQLKKHRDNYHQDKEDKNHIQLDGTISASTLFNANGDSSLISWVPGNDSGFEVRNPKSSSFVTMMGVKYDENATTSQELAGVNTLDDVIPTYNNGTTYSKGDKCMLDNRMYMSRINENIGNNPSAASYGSKPKDVFKKATAEWIEITYTNEVKKNVIRLSTYLKQVEDADAVYEASGKTAADKATFKTVFESFVDPKNLIDYLIIADVVGGISAAKNWQWCTYDGIKWYIGLYDCDNALGQYFEVTETRRNPNTDHTIKVMFHQYIIKYYNEELEAWYKELRDNKIITVNHIVNLVKEWQAAVGAVNMMLEYNKWTGSTRFDSLFRLEKWITVEITNMDSVYHYN